MSDASTPMSSLRLSVGSREGSYPSRQNRLYNSIVNVVLVYGVDETFRALDINEEGTIQDVYDSLLLRDITLQFLQIMAPGQVYPNKEHSKFMGSGHANTPTDRNPNLGEGISRKFRIDDFGLAWETIETLQYFIYPEGSQLYHKEKEPSCVPMLLTDIQGARSFAVGLKFSRPFFVVKPEDGGHGHYNLIPWSVSTGCPSNGKLLYLPTCVVMVSKNPYFSFLKEALSGLYRLVSDEDKDISFWDTIHDFAEKLFLVPCLPEGMLSLELTLPGFSSSTLIMPPRGVLHLDVRLNYPFMCLSIENVLKVIAAILCEQTIIFTSSHYSIPALIIQCFLSYISPFEWRQSVVPIIPNSQIDMLGAPGINIMGCHSNCQDDPEFMSIDDAVIVKLDENMVESRLTFLPQFPELPQSATSRFKTQYQQLLEGDFEIEGLERVVLSSAVERERARHNYEHYKDTILSALFLELMVRIFDFVSEGLLESRAVFETRLKMLPEKDQFFYKHATQTDMFSVFMMSRRMRVRDDFNILADQLKKQARKASDPVESGIPTFQQPTLSVMNPFTRRSRHSISASLLGVGTTTYHQLQKSLSNSLLPPGSNVGCADDRNTPPFVSWAYSKTSFFKELQCLELPSFDTNEPFNREKYIDQVLEVLDDMTQDKTIQANCVCLYAYYKIARGDVMKGIELFSDDLQRLNSTLVPSPQQLYDFVSLLNNEEREIIQTRTYYKLIAPRRVSQMSDRYHSQSSSIVYVKDISVCYKFSLVLSPSLSLSLSLTHTHTQTNSRPGSKPVRRKPLVHSEFSKEVKQENIAKDPESASNLFSVLQSVGHSASVSPEIFQTFLDSWKQVIQDIEGSISGCQFNFETEKTHKVQERVLAVSPNSRSNSSAHCIVVLTSHRILLLSSAGLKERIFAELPELHISSICMCEMSTNVISPKIPIIKVELGEEVRPHYGNVRPTQKGRKTSDPFIGFNNSTLRNLWYRMIKEVVFGWQVVFAKKDPTVMDQVECHIKMISALYRTGWMDDLDSSVKLKWSQKILSLQSKPVPVDKLATEALQYRINPNTDQIDKATIESTLFVHSAVAGGEGKLWLGLGNGCLRVYDIETRCFESDLKVVDSRRGKTVRVSCLLLVDYHVWVGSLSKTIHILDVETLCHVSQLSYLEDEPRDLALSESEPRLVWALLLNGILIGFDPETREKVAKITVPNMTPHSFCTCFTIWREFLWVGTNRGSIAILSTINRSCVNELYFPGSHRQVDIKYLAVSSEDEIWCSVHCYPRSEDSTFVAVYNPRNQQRLYTYSELDGNHRVSFILPVRNTVWCGTKSGQIYVFSAKTENNREGPKILNAHEDKVRSMTVTDNDLVISGSASNDGYANVWKLMNWFDD